MSAASNSEEQLLSHTRGFGSFHFAPVDDEGHDAHRNKKATSKAAAAAAAPPLKPTMIPSTFPFMKLPLEIRNKIYGHFIDPLRETVRGSESAHRTFSSSGPPPQHTGPALHMYVFDKTFDPYNEDDNVAVEPMLVEGAPDKRNVDPRTGAPLNVLEMYKAIRSGEFDEDETDLPSNWLRVREEEPNLWKPGGEEPDAEMSEEDEEASDWDSDSAEIAENLRKNVMPIVVDEDDDDDVKIVSVKSKAPKKKKDVAEIVDSDSEEEEDYVPSEDEDSDESESKDSDGDSDVDFDLTQDMDDSDDNDDPTYEDSAYDKQMIEKAKRLAGKKRPASAMKPFVPRCYVAIYSRYLTSPDCTIHRADDPGLDFEDLWACATCSHRDPAAYYNLRRLSQVSPLMTVELGKALWRGATVEFDGPETFLALAEERPAVLPLIRNVVLNLEINPILPLGRAGTKNLESMLKIASEKMDLDSFKTQLSTPHSETFYVDSKPEPDWGSESRKEWAPLFRGLRTRRFLLSTVDSWRPKAVEGEQLRQLEEVLDRWFKSLIEEWMPDCLRDEADDGKKIKREETPALRGIALRLRNSITPRL